MKFSTVFALLLGASVLSAHAAPATPDQTGRKAIQTILRGAPIDSVKSYFDDSVKVNLTPEVIEAFKGEISWLTGMLGDSLDLYMSGTQLFEKGDSLYYREYRLANESNTRSPLLLIHLLFADSASFPIVGAYNKSFLEDTQNRLAGPQTWKIGSDSVEVHSVGYLEFEGGVLPVVRVYDADTARIDSATAHRKGLPIVREAVARGYLDSVKAVLGGRKLLENFGVALLRREPHQGYVQYKFGIKKKDYDPAGTPTKKGAAKKTGAKAAPKKKTSP